MEQGRSSADFDTLLRQVRELTALVEQQQTAIAEKLVLIEQQQATIAAQHEQLTRAAEQIALLKKALFAPRRERYAPSPDQQLLFTPEIYRESGAESAADIPAAVAETPAESTPRAKQRRPREKFIFPQCLPVEQIKHPLEDSECPCGCCGQPRVVIGEHVTRQLELKPAEAYVVEHVRYTYACAKCRDGQQVITTSKPPAAIEKSPFGASVLAWMVSAKFERHLPLYRQQEMLLAPVKRWLSRSLLCKLMRGTARALQPLADRLKHEILLSCVTQADETPVRYLPGQAGKSSLGYLFGYAGDDAHPFVWYDFRASRSREGPCEVLAGYRGFLQTDGYSAYESLVAEYSDRLTAVACWAHARRDFDEARYTTSHPALHETLAWIQQLYDIEDRAGEKSADDRRALRMAESAPLVEKIFARLEEVRPELRPSSKLAEAVSYTLNRQPALRQFLTDGRIAIDTNRLERQFRAAAVGRKNWLFFGSLAGGQTAATLYSIVQTARWHRLDVQTYLTDVLRRLPALRPDDTEGLTALLPNHWATAHPQHLLEPRIAESRAAQQLRRTRRAARRQHDM
jgi:transposase